MRVKLMTVSARTSPGKISTHGAWISTSRPSASIRPSDGVGRLRAESEEAESRLDLQREGGEDRDLHDDRADRVGHDVPDDRS